MAFSAGPTTAAQLANRKNLMSQLIIRAGDFTFGARFEEEAAPKTCAAIPFWPRMFSPTMQISAFRPSYFTSANLRRSAAISGRRSFESTVSETLTSEVDTISTEHLWRSNTSKTAFR